MTFTLASLIEMALRTLSNPREGANEVLALGIPRNILWLALAVTVLLTTLTMGLSALVDLTFNGAPTVAETVPSDPNMPQPVSIGPMALALIVGFSAVVTVYGVHFIGRLFGGTGGFDESLALVTWLQFIILGPAILNALFGPISPLLGGIITLAALAMQLWLLTHFVSVIHGFPSLGTVFVMILLSGFAVGSVAIILLSSIGIATGVLDVPQPGTLQ